MGVDVDVDVVIAVLGVVVAVDVVLLGKMAGLGALASEIPSFCVVFSKTMPQDAANNNTR